MSDENVIGCVRVEDGGIVAMGSVKRVCADCGADVWVSPSGLEIIARGVTPVCMLCIAVRLREPDADVEVQPMTATQLAELVTNLHFHGRRN